MNLAHIHLLLNHWPIIGSFVALGLFLVALVANSDDLKQASLAFFALLALLAIPTYMSGDVVHEVLKQSKSVSETLVQAHQGFAMLALAFMELTGGVALIGLWQYSRMSRSTPAPVARWNVPAVLLLSIVTVVLMSLTGNTGGAIRHPEILTSQEQVSSLGSSAARLVPLVVYVVT